MITERSHQEALEQHKTRRFSYLFGGAVLALGILWVGITESTAPPEAFSFLAFAMLTAYRVLVVAIFSFSLVLIASIVQRAFSSRKYYADKNGFAKAFKQVSAIRMMQEDPLSIKSAFWKYGLVAAVLLVLYWLFPIYLLLALFPYPIFAFMVVLIECVPPYALLLSVSSRNTLAMQSEMNLNLRPMFVAALLRPDMAEREIQLGIGLGAYRILDDTAWHSVVVELAHLTPVIVFDLREHTERISIEIDIVFEENLFYKTVFIIPDGPINHAVLFNIGGRSLPRDSLLVNDITAIRILKFLMKFPRPTPTMTIRSLVEPHLPRLTYPPRS